MSRFIIPYHLPSTTKYIYISLKLTNLKFYKINKVNKDIEVHLKITAAHLGSVQVSGCYLDHENKMTNRRKWLTKGIDHFLLIKQKCIKLKNISKLFRSRNSFISKISVGPKVKLHFLRSKKKKKKMEKCLFYTLIPQKTYTYHT